MLKVRYPLFWTMTYDSDLFLPSSRLYHRFGEFFKPLLRFITYIMDTFQVYDYLLTFEDEVEFMWEGRWNVLKIVFFLNRYLPFADCVVGLVGGYPAF
jgi:hypothetical protein